MNAYIPAMETRAGMVAIIGLPNSGKSSLLNELVESRLSIVTPLAQTTREQVVGIDTRDDVQMVFLDTPGIVDPAYLLHRSMLRIVERTITDADVGIFLIDGTRPPPSLPSELEALLRSVSGRVLPVINKTDLMKDGQAGPLSAWSRDVFGADPLQMAVSTGDGVGALREAIASRLPISPFLYPDDDLSTQTLRFFASELVRETVFEQYKDEIPYSVAVRVEEYREGSDPIYIRGIILVERASQKGIIIGRGGAAIRDLGVAAREKIEDFLGSPVYLDLWVKVLPRWRKSSLELSRLGFPIPDDID